MSQIENELLALDCCLDVTNLLFSGRAKIPAIFHFALFVTLQRQQLHFSIMLKEKIELSFMHFINVYASPLALKISAWTHNYLISAYIKK